jgi:hypothetical protein
MYIDPKGKFMVEDDDDCKNCRKIMRQKVSCPLILALGQGVCNIRDDDDYDGSMIVKDCPLHEEKNLKVVKNGRDGNGSVPNT